MDRVEGLKRLFRLEILDQNKLIYSKEGYNQLTLSHFLFRSSVGLADPTPENEEEAKH